MKVDKNYEKLFLKSEKKKPKYYKDKHTGKIVKMIPVNLNECLSFNYKAIDMETNETVFINIFDVLNKRYKEISKEDAFYELL